MTAYMTKPINPKKYDPIKTELERLNSRELEMTLQEFKEYFGVDGFRAYPFMTLNRKGIVYGFPHEPRFKRENTPHGIKEYYKKKKTSDGDKEKLFKSNIKSIKLFKIVG